MDEWREIGQRDDGTPIEVTRKAHSQRFAEFHAANPDVYEELVVLARQARAQGIDHYGIRSLWEVMRWHRLMRLQDKNTKGVRLNDHYHSRYARLIMNNEPDLSEFFELRKLKTS